MTRRRIDRRLLLLVSVSSLGLQIGLTAPSGAVSLNNNVAADTATAHGVYDDTNAYPNVVWVNGCTGTLINSRTILTAAHCFSDDKTDQLKPNLSIDVRFGADADAGTPRTVFDQHASGLAVAPGYTFNGTDSDIAVVTLSTPVTRASIAPVVLVGPDDPRPPPGSLMVTVGYGQYGTGEDGGRYADPDDPNDAPYDSRRRVGETRLGDYVLWTYGGRAGEHGVFAAQFRDPKAPAAHDDYQLDAQGFDVPAGQAGNGAGDSGGPLFLVLPDGSLLQVGVLALLETAADGTIRYGSISGWAAIQDYQAWLAAIDPLREVSARAGDVAWSDASAWSENEVPDNQVGAFDGPYGLAGRYFDVRLFEPGRVSLDMDATIDALSVFGARTVLDITTDHKLEVITGASIWSGEIVLDGVMAAPYLNMLGGVLSGTGTFEVTDFGVQDLAFGVFNQAGVVAPGGPTRTGVLSIIGDYTQGPHGALWVRLGDGGADRLAVTGQASLAGTVELSGFGPVTLDTPYTVLAANAVTGGFDKLITDFAFLETSLSYSPSAVSASLSRNTVAFSDVARTSNQASVAAALDTLDPSGRAYRSVLGLSASAARAAFDLSSGEIHASVNSMLIEGGRSLRDAATRRLREMAAAPNLRAAFNALGDGATGGASPASSAGRFALWGQAYGASGHVDGDGNAARVDRRSSGMVVGGDALFDNTWRLGVLAGYNQASFNVASRLSSGTSDSYHLGLYGDGSFGSVSLRSGAFYSAHDVSTSRNVLFGGGSGNQARASYHAHAFQAFGEIANRWQSLTGAIEPYLNLAHVRLMTDGFTEQAQDIALRAARQTTDVTYTTVGLRASRDFAVASQEMSVGGGIGWRRAFGDRLPLSTLGLSTASFTIAGVAIAQDTAVFDASVHAYLANNAIFSLSYNGQLASSASEHAITAKLKIGL